MPDPWDVAIVGGGAAGLTTAIFAAQRGKRVLILDSAKTLGAKILVSGGGRCNVTHVSVASADFNGIKPIVRNVLAAFSVQATVAWFSSMGVELKQEETGKLFPKADSAKAVLNALLRRCTELGVVIQGGCKVAGIEKPGTPASPFIIKHSNGQASADRLVICTGGKSLPKTGSDGSGWELVKQLGHTVTSTHAALTPLVLDQRMFHAEIAGISHNVQLQTLVDGKVLDRRQGSLLWTHFGISGPVVMDASRYWVIASETGKAARMECNLLGSQNYEHIEAWLIEQSSQRAKAALLTVISTRLPERVARAVIGHSAIDPNITCGQMTRAARRNLVASLTALHLPIVQHRGWNYAEVTAGGVPLSEINFRTMESRTIPKLYLAGEILDCDSRIGGFNFQWAWATGQIAGSAVSAAIKPCVLI